MLTVIAVYRIRYGGRRDCIGRHEARSIASRRMSRAFEEQAEIAPPEPGLTAEDLVARAAGLRDLLRGEQAATEERSYYSDEVHEAIRDAGLYRVLQPRRFGGYELGIEAFYRVVMELSRGCPSTGWCFCLGAAHVLQVAAFYSEAAQREIFGDDGHFVAASRDLPSGTVTPVDDGYLVDGTWNYCSGAPHSTHFVARARLAERRGEAGDGAPLVLVTVPRADWTLLDDWHGVLGLRGSGSHSIAVDGAFVPEHWVVADDPFDLEADGDATTSTVHPNPIYNSRHLNFFHGELGSIMVGVAEAAVDEFERILLTSRTADPLPPGRRRDAADYQRPLGLGMAMAAAARQVVLGAAREHTERCRLSAQEGVPYRAADDLLLESVQGQACRLAFEAIELMARMSGSSNVIRDGRRMGRYLRDALVYRSHQQGASVEMMATKLGRAHLDDQEETPR
jgi:3-hydroxy-9,10-secoandrosta-1,3,5(10)-triene-9,17-dione monooxygenase